MANLDLSDFYYGAVLSQLINNKFSPALIESDKNRRIYNFAIDGSGDFALLLKYRSARPRKTKGYSSWQFNLTDSDLNKINGYLTSRKDIRLCLILLTDSLSNSKYAILYKDDIRRLLDLSLTSFTISFKKSENYYRISKNHDREGGFKVECNRDF